MGYLDLGGGLAVDYDGSNTNYMNSRNYTVEEYCTDIVEAVMTTLDPSNVPHPVIITESGKDNSGLLFGSGFQCTGCCFL